MMQPSRLLRVFSGVILSRRASFSPVPKSQCSDNRCSSAAYSFIDSPSLWSRLWNRKRSAITRGLGAMCRVSSVTSSSYSLSPGLSGAVRERKSVNVFR